MRGALMKRTALTLMLTFALLLLFIGNVQSFQEVNETSKIFELMPEAFQGRQFVDLRKGDTIICNFTVSNRGPYKNLVFGGYDLILVHVKFLMKFMDREGAVIKNFENTSGGFFSYTAPHAGTVEIGTYCGQVAFYENAAYPVLAIDYEIERKPIELINPDLLAWWKLDEGNGTEVTDSSGNEYEGIIHGANWITNQENILLNFDGESDYVSLPSLDLRELDSLTVVAWINSDLTEEGYIIFHGHGGQFTMANVYSDEDTQSVTNPTYARFSVKLNPHNWYSILSSFPMKPNTWHQIVGVLEKGISLKVYIDGVLAGENNDIPAEHLYDPSMGGSWPSSLGIDAQGHYDTQVFFKGQISNVMMFNKTLEIQELFALYDDVPFPPPPTPKPEQTEQDLTTGAVLAVTSIVVFLSLFVYFIKRG